METVSHSGLDTEVYDLRPADYTTSTTTTTTTTTLATVIDHGPVADVSRLLSIILLLHNGFSAAGGYVPAICLRNDGIKSGQVRPYLRI